ncbi:MAG TPA: hypothetical protein VMM17_06595, partial [Gemmatimonadaceae bacterium]|nr:hypothetical protein [Gemmatimonadaceae bacterium]
DGAYGSLHQARLNSRRAFAVVAEFSTAATAAADARTQSLLRTIEGYTYVTFSEGWCGGVPFSRIPDTGPLDPAATEFGVALTTNQMNDTAVTRFNEARTLQSTNRFAAVGLGRALLNLGRYQEAATAVAAVPTTFVHFIEHSPSTGAQNNPVFSLQSNGRYGISNLEGATSPTGTSRPDAPTSGSAAPPLTAAGAEGLPFRGFQDPRVPYRSRPNCFTGSVRCWLNNNYPDFEADVPVASGVEARLIEAEAAYQRGDFVTMMAKLNELRANASANLAVLYPRQVQTFPAIGLATLAPLTDPGTAEGRRNLVFQERALWMYNTGHRQGDLRRLVRNYGLASTAVWPTGPHFRGSSYGDDVAYPVPFNEENNPSFVRSACNTEQN